MKFLSLRKLSSMLSFLCVCVGIGHYAVFAQDKDWRPVSPAELSAKPKVEPDADAEAMFWETRIDDSSDEDLSLRHYVRVKIFTERGREKYSKFDIPFTKGIKIKELAARVIKADGTTTEITKEDIFEREIVKASGVKVKAKSFAVPNIEPGVIVEYRYKEAISDAGATGMRLAFQRDIPVQVLSYYYKPYNSREPDYQTYNFTDTRFIKDQKGFWLAERKNVPAFREEPRMPPEDVVRPYMLLIGARIALTGVSGYSISYVIKDPNNPTSYWAGVGLQYTPAVKLMTKAATGDVKKTALEITAGANSPEEKLHKIYDFCQTQIKNTTYDPSLTDDDRKKLPKIESVGDVLKRKSGPSGYIDMLFGAMVSAIELEPRLAFTANRSEIFFTPEMTNENLLRRSAIAVKVGDAWQYFNPGVPFVPYGMLPWYKENSWALLVGEKKYGWEQTPLTDIKGSQSKRTGKFKLTDDGTLEGTVRIEYSGHPALNYRMENYDETVAKLEENLSDEVKKQYDGAEVTEVRVENITEHTKPLVHQYKIRVPNYAQKTGKRIFLQPGFFEHNTEPMFSSATRKYDVSFRYPWSEVDKVSLELPAGYDLDSADAPAPLADPQKIGSLDIKISVDKNHANLFYDRAFHFGGGAKLLFPADSYKAVKNLFDAFQKSEAHTITLKQKL